MENTIQKKLESVAISFTKFKDQYSACKYLYLPDTEEEKKFLKNSRYFKMVKIALFRNSIIELCKIIKGSKNNYFNLYALFKAIKKSSEFDTNQLDEIRDLETKLKEISPTTDRIITLRNDFVAHTKLDSIDPNIEFIELDSYVLQLEELIRQLYRIFDSHIEFSPILFDKERFNIISILARDKEQRLNSL